MRKLLGITLALLVCAAVPANAAVWYVCAATGSDANTGASPDAPFATIRTAVALLSAGDEVRIAAGTYAETLVVTGLDGISFTGGWDSAFTTATPPAGETVVTGDYSAAVFSFISSRQCSLKGLTVKSGSPNVYVEDLQSEIVNLTIDGCTITDSLGYGVYFRGAWVVTQNSNVVYNGQDGLAGHSPYEVTRGDVFDSVVSYNGVRYSGGGLYFISNKLWRAYNSIFVGNSGFGIWKAYPGSAMLVYNNVIMQNGAGGVGTGYYGMMDCKNNVVAYNGAPGFNNVQNNYIWSDYNDVYGNTGGDYFQVAPGAHDLSVDPGLDADWHLNPDSPLLDRGTDLSAYLTHDVDGDPRSASAGGDGLFDIGADEAGDRDGDGWTVAQGDCDDRAASVFPGAVEIIKDGIDQDCNGRDLTIVVTSAVWSAKKKRLTVEATSDLNAAAALQVTGFGPMVWNRKSQNWTLSVSAGANPGAVVVSGVEGSVTKIVTVQ